MTKSVASAQCGNCGAPCEGQARFCQECGNSLVERAAPDGVASAAANASAIADAVSEAVASGAPSQSDDVTAADSDEPESVPIAILADRIRSVMAKPSFRPVALAVVSVLVIVIVAFTTSNGSSGVYTSNASPVQGSWKSINEGSFPDLRFQGGQISAVSNDDRGTCDGVYIAVGQFTKYSMMCDVGSVGGVVGYAVLSPDGNVLAAPPSRVYSSSSASTQCFARVGSAAAAADPSVVRPVCDGLATRGEPLGSSSSG